MSPELQVTLLWVGILAVIFVMASALSGAPLFALPFFFGGIGGALGAFVGELMGSSVAGAIVGGTICLIGFFILAIHLEVKSDKRREIARHNRNNSGSYPDIMD